MNSNKIITAALLLYAALTCFSCGNSIPQISGVNSQQYFLISPESGEIGFFINLYVNADDKDGIEDLLNLYLLSDDDELLWRSSSEDWVIREQNGIEWRGIEKLVLSENSVFSPGTYRLILKDRAGEQVNDEIIIRPVGQDLNPDTFPRLSASNENSSTLLLESPYENSIISFYDKSGELLQAYRTTNGTILIRDLPHGDDVSRKYQSVYVSAYNDKIGAAFMAGPYFKGSF